MNNTTSFDRFVDGEYFTEKHCDVNNWTYNFEDFCEEYDLKGVNLVDKKIELETKCLKEYPEWQFLSEEELNRVAIEIYNDLKIAKRFCNKEQKVIKVPNTDVFQIVSRHLIAKGITRIVSSDKLIAL